MLRFAFPYNIPGKECFLFDKHATETFTIAILRSQHHMLNSVVVGDIIDTIDTFDIRM